ncbi:tetratricopeptide repeat protein [Geobacter grbiciae]|uniref:tetratricopeptide repeat protein n=1 Tax=Geobacter grbiciae TaxID=155042 RepID=UPI001C02251D|nr:tetratricopeptide repeat protein [Geobacter grbiciae]MBT1077041.1 sel1 repeat family protein [Geobacter grbiciae]
MKGRLTAAVTCSLLAALLLAVPDPSASARVGRNGKTPAAQEFARTRGAAQRGDAGAAFRLALMFLDGTGVARNPAESVRFMKIAAERGHVRAQYFLGTLFHEGVGVKQDQKEAARWIARAAAGGNAEAQYAYGLLLLSGDGVPVDKVAAMGWLGKASRQGSRGARDVLRQLVALPGRPTEIRSLEPSIAAPRAAPSADAADGGAHLEGMGVILDQGEFGLRFSVPHLKEAIAPVYPAYSPDKGVWNRIQGGTFEIIYRPGAK